MSEEVWKRVPSCPGYFASSLGRIMKAPNVKKLPNGGYRMYGGEPHFGQWDGVRFILQYKGKTRKVHRMVCEAFHGPAPAKTVCMHIDEDSRNNKPENLTWATQKENLNCPGFIEYCKSRTGENSPKRKGIKKNEHNTTNAR